MVSAKAPLAPERAGFVTGFKVKPRKVNAKGTEAIPSTIVFAIETDNDSKLLEFLGKVQREGAAVNFGLELSQAELSFPAGS